MKVEQVIAELQKFKKGTDVCIFDYRKNCHHSDADDEGSGIGIQSDFNIDFVSENVNKPFIAISYENCDYDKDGGYNAGSSICASIQKDLKTI